MYRRFVSVSAGSGRGGGSVKAPPTFPAGWRATSVSRSTLQSLEGKLSAHTAIAMIKDLKTAVSKVRAALMRRGRTAHDADDLVQEAWLRLACYERKERVEQPEAFLMRVATNLSTDWYRSRAHHGEEVMLDHVVLIDAAPSTEAVVLAREQSAHLSVCVGRLDRKTRDILLAHRLEGLSHREIARRHRTSVSSVEKHIAKALYLLSSSMNDWYP